MQVVWMYAILHTTSRPLIRLLLPFHYLPLLKESLWRLDALSKFGCHQTRSGVFQWSSQPLPRQKKAGGGVYAILDYY